MIETNKGSRLRRLGRAVAATLLTCMAPPASLAEGLPALGVDLSQTTVSGLSSGAYMAGQFHLAHSRYVIGAAILSGGPFGCAKSDVGPWLPSRGEETANLSTALMSCVSGYLAPFGLPDGEKLATLARGLAEDGKIDPIAGVLTAKVYVFHGRDDAVLAASVARAAVDFYRHLGVPARNIAFVQKPGGHAFLTLKDGNACASSSPPHIDACGFDEAGELLGFLLGPLKPKGNAKEESFVAFSQISYGAREALMDDGGFAYIPAACRARGACKAHVVFHGCNQAKGQVNDAVARKAGYAEWAETNGLVVVFPQVKASRENPLACWDWWGYTGSAFLTRQAPQIKAVAAMLAVLAQ